MNTRLIRERSLVKIILTPSLRLICRQKIQKKLHKEQNCTNPSLQLFIINEIVPYDCLNSHFRLACFNVPYDRAVRRACWHVFCLIYFKLREKRLSASFKPTDIDRYRLWFSHLSAAASPFPSSPVYARCLRSIQTMLFRFFGSTECSIEIHFSGSTLSDCLMKGLKRWRRPLRLCPESFWQRMLCRR